MGLIVGLGEGGQSKMVLLCLGQILSKKIHKNSQNPAPPIFRPLIETHKDDNPIRPVINLSIN